MGQNKPGTALAHLRFVEWSPQCHPEIPAYALTARIAASTCLMCSCPASRANLSLTYAHLAAHPQAQMGRLTSRLPSFSGRIVTLWVTLLIVLLLPYGAYTRSTGIPGCPSPSRVYLCRRMRRPRGATVQPGAL
jgi:hypothetical protein